MKKGWEIKTLGEVCETGSGGTPISTNKKYYEGGNIPWLRSGEVCRKEITNSEIFITEEGMKNSSAKIFPVNSVLIAMYGATAGQVGVLKFESTTNQAICAVLPNEKLLPEFLYYHLSKIKEYIVSKAVGAARNNLSQEIIKKFPIPIPPIQEQEEIVERLDKGFELIDSLKETAKKNLDNAKELFQSVLREELSPKEGWEIKKLGEVCDIINGCTPKTNIDEYWNGNINWITPKDMGKLTSKYVYETERNITELGLKKSSAKLIPKNSIILSSRAPIGHLAINKVEISTNQGCKGIIPLNINEHYIYYFLLNSVEYLDSLGSGTTFKELSNTKLSEVLIPIPPIKEQEEIVGRLDRIKGYCDELEGNYKRVLELCEELKQGLLREAFSY